MFSPQLLVRRRVRCRHLPLSRSVAQACPSTGERRRGCLRSRRAPREHFLTARSGIISRRRYICYRHFLCIPRKLFSLLHLFTPHTLHGCTYRSSILKTSAFSSSKPFQTYKILIQKKKRSNMHSCEKCAFLSQTALSDVSDISLSTLEKAGQGEVSCPILAVVCQGVMLYKEKWGLWREKVRSIVRMTNDRVLEVDIYKVYEVLPVRIAMVEFYVLPGKV